MRYMDMQFRIWSVINNKYCYPPCYVLMWNGEFKTFDFEQDFIDVPEDILIERCSGIKDKHGHYIYQNDIVKCGDKIFTVYFGNKDYEHLLLCDKEGFVFEFRDFISCGFEIIGNIHNKNNDCDIENKSSSSSSTTPTTQQSFSLIDALAPR